MDKPKDMLEFLRRASHEPAAAPPEAGLERTPRVVVLRRSQLLVAAVATGTALILAFVLGLAIGGDGASPAPTFIKVAEYEDSDAGRRAARSVKEQLERYEFGEEVRLVRLPGGERIAVALGPLTRDPRSDEARSLLRRVQTLPDRRTGEPPFANADFWVLKR